MVGCPSVRPSVRLSVPSIDGSSDVRLVCWYRSIDAARARAAVACGVLLRAEEGGSSQTCWTCVSSILRCTELTTHASCLYCMILLPRSSLKFNFTVVEVPRERRSCTSDYWQIAFLRLQVRKNAQERLYTTIHIISTSMSLSILTLTAP